MKRSDLKALYPNASDAFLTANASDPRPLTELERAAGNDALATPQKKERDSRRFLVRITSSRKRLLDEDNLAEKYHCDCLRYSGILPSDAPSTTNIEVRQVKAGKAEEAITVEVFHLNPPEPT